MASRLLEPRGNIKDSRPSSSSGPGPDEAPPPPPPPTTAVIDIGAFVVRYNRLLELLYPLGFIWSTSLYVIRWENYLLTLSVLLISCVLFYSPALLIGTLVASAVVGMAIGKYYSQTKLSSNMKLREVHQVEHLDVDAHLFGKCKKDQKASHRSLLEYRQILCDIEGIVVMASNVMEYVYKIILWKSLEVSSCITALLGVLFMLLCTVDLRILLASLPLFIMCFNKYFLKRVVELWKAMVSLVYTNMRLKHKSESHHLADSTQIAMVDSTLSIQDQLTTEPEPEVVESSDFDDETNPHHAENQGGASARLEVNGTISSSDLASRGFCNKCNTSLAKLLKRKHVCNSCGQSYCGSCTVKVKRWLLGATSPAAYEESVRVCLDCKDKLDALATCK